MKKLIIGSLLSLIGIPFSQAQQQRIVADRIVAQVGDNIVLQSDLENAIRDYKRNAEAGVSPALPPDAECTFLRTFLQRKVLMVQAQRDSLPLSDADVDGKLDNQIRYMVSQAGSRELFEQYAGKTLYQFREDMRPYLKEQLLAQNMQQKIVSAVKITPEEVESYYSKIPKDSLRYYEAQLEIGQVIMHPKANKDVEEYLTEQLMEYKKEVESGKRKFEDLVKLYSEDPGSKDKGGMYPINRLSKQFDPTFTSAAFRLKDGQISPVVKTQFGYHIIQMVSHVGDDAVVRHLLLIPPISQKDLTIAEDSLKHVRQLIVDKKITFNAAVSAFGDDESGKYSGGSYMTQDGSTSLTYDQIQDPSLISLLKNMQPGDISEPQVFTDNGNRGQQSVRIIYLRSKSEPHRENLKDDYNKIADRALQIKQEKTLNEWFVTHIPTFYIHIDPNATKGCSNIAEWKRVSDELENGQQIVVN